MNMVLEKSKEFFDLTEEEKKEFEEKGVLDPIRYGTSFNSKKDEIFYWRDFLRVIVHPEFNFPSKPLGLRLCFIGYSVFLLSVFGLASLRGFRTRNRVCDKQGFGFRYRSLDFGTYPIGSPPHSDHGLLSLLINNGVTGLQIKHKGKWFNVNNDIPNSFLVNTADQLHVRIKLKHFHTKGRLSVVVANGPSLDAVVEPAYKLVTEEKCPPTYIPMKYMEYLEMQQGNQIGGKSYLDKIRA
ncbi:putative flavanone 3-dioxygenase [Helianthus anomalus]